MRSMVHRLGYRFRLHRRDLPGKPDLTLPRHKAVLFVNGCFWHWHPDHLLQVFHRPEPEALQIMLAVHHQGVGVAGVYTYEIAEAKVNRVAELAGAEDFPLLCTLEQE